MIQFWRESGAKRHRCLRLRTIKFKLDSNTQIITEREREREMGVSENSKGLILAVASSVFIGASFILKKKGLKRAGAYGTSAGQLGRNS